jgi:DedD protein
MMAENATSADAELQLKKRARRRLVGATALALLAIIVLPMVMDREPRPPARDIQVRIPSPESNTLPPLRAPVAAPPAEHPASPANAEPAAPASTTASAAEDKVPAVSTTTPAIPTQPHADAKTAVQAPSRQPAAAPPGAQQQTIAQSAVAQAQWVVQLGAYKDDKNVKHLLAKLKELKLPAYTEKVGEGQDVRTRVRAGPFASREMADKAQARITKIGVNGSVAEK